MRINIKTDDLYESDLFFDLDTIQINPNDTIVATIDPDYIDFDIANEIAKSMIKAFPENTVICKLKGMEISIK